MSRRSSSKSFKQSKQNKGGRATSSLGDAIAAKDPKLAKTMQEMAEKKTAYTVEKKNISSPRRFTHQPRQKTQTQKPVKSSQQKTPIKTNYEIEKPKRKRPVKPLVQKKAVELKPYQLLLAEIEKLEHREDGIPSVPPDIKNHSSTSALTDASNGFIEYLTRPQQTEPVVFVIGCDFGTSSTKIVIQQAFADGRAVALPVPEPFRPDWVNEPKSWRDRLSWDLSTKKYNGHPHCWKTLLYHENQTGRFSLLNGEGKKEINNIKTTVMSAKNPVIASSGGIQLTADHAAAAYLGLILRYTKGWLYQHSQKHFGIDLKKYHIQWEINMGLPAASLDDKKIARTFHDILNTGWLISENDEPVTVEMVYENFVKAASKTEQFEELTNLRPEVTAEAVCLIYSDLLDYKTYILVDVGASTLDVCVFNYFDKDDTQKQTMLVAEVKLLGAQSIEWLKQLSQADGTPFTEDHLKQAIRFNIANPIIQAKTKKDIHSPVWSGELEILMAGGGAASAVHQTAIDDLGDFFTKQTRAKKVIRRNPSVPRMFSHMTDDQSSHRLAVAWGLSLFQNEFMDYDPPSNVSDMMLNKSSMDDNFISKDLV